jgi:hypothetical protein
VGLGRVSILATGAIINTGANYATVSGESVDGTVQFNPNAGTINVPVSDWSSYTLKEDIEAGLQAKLEASPYNMTFGSGDVCRIVP